MPSPQEVEAQKRIVLDDPNTAKIASTLGLTKEEYVAKVFKYLENPNLDPVVQVMTDDELRSMGYKPVDVKEVADYLNDIADAREISTKSKFADPNSPRERAQNAIPNAPAAKARPEQVREDLKAELERVRSTVKIDNK